MSRSNARACQQWNSSERLWVIAHQHIHNCLNLSFAASRLPNSLTHSKAFVYLSEVSASSHPTLIASGTQNTFYYTYDHPHFPLTRFSDGGVRAHHVVHAMLGPRGGGFLFDSNGASCDAHGAHGSNSSWALGTGAHANLLTALSLSLSLSLSLIVPFMSTCAPLFLPMQWAALHKIEMEGSLPRRVVVMEFHPRGGKVPRLSARDNPCPSLRRQYGKMPPKSMVRVLKYGVPGYPMYPPDRDEHYS